ALRELGREGPEAVVGVGAANPHRHEIAATATDAARIQVNPADMAGLMGWADFALAAAGSTCWELCCIGLPALLLVLADNQAPLAAACDRAGVARDLGSQHRLTARSLAEALRASRAGPDFR